MSFQIEQLNEDLWLITEPWFSEHANLYLLHGTDATLLIDAGMGLSNLSTWLDGKGLSPDIAVTTHIHFDHCSGLKDFSAGTVHLTKEQARNISNPSLWGLQYLNEEHAVEEYRSIMSSFQTAPPTEPVDLQDSIDLGNYTLQVIPAPGHTDDSVLFYEPTKGWLFTGDTLYEGELYTDLPNTNLRDWRETLTSMADLTPSAVFPGHNKPVIGCPINKLVAQGLAGISGANAE